MDPSEILGFPQFNLQGERARHNATKLQNAGLIQQLKNANAEKEALKEQLDATQTDKLRLETENVELIGKLEKKDKAAEQLMADVEEDMEKIYKQHAKQLTKKDLEIRTLENQLAASQEASTRTQSLETENAELIHQLENMNVAMRELLAERDVLRGQHAAILEERDFYMQADKLRAGTVQKLQEQLHEHSKELTDKNLEIQALKTLLAASQEESMKLQEQHDIVLCEKDRMIHNQDVRLNSEVQKYADKLKVLQEQHVEQIEAMDLELKTLEDELKTGQEQHAKELNDKDLAIRELKARLSAAEQQTADQLVEFTNEKDRLSLSIQKIQEDCLKAERGLQDVRVMLKEVQRQKEKEATSEPTTQLHIELGKLYMELQEAKKPQEAQMAAKNKEMEYLTKQHEEKLAAKESDIQNLAEIVKEGEEKNKNREEMIANLRKIMFAMEYEMTEMKKKFNAEKQAALQGPKLAEPKAPIEYEDIPMDPSNVFDYLTQQLQNKNSRIHELFAERYDLVEELSATEAAKEELETQNTDLIGQLKKMDMAMQELVEERDAYKKHIQVINEDAERNQAEYLKELNDKDRMIQMLMTQLGASEGESAKKEEELQEYHAQESSNKSQLIYNLNMRLCLEEQQYTEKLTVLRKEHAKQVEGMNLELQLLKTQQEQHVKELNDKDLAIQDLAIRLSAAEQQTIDKMMELTNELKKKDEVAHIELGKLYMDLQEAKKPQDALMARLAAKNKGIEYLTKQHETKLAAKDSEIQRLTEMVREKNI
ncbi:hypothetical protein GCK72_015898 [Caenorhabditis remanei]|uniref:Uncharacterized protein n=1 Tax=Caenorhabditis remanei TaxID=31234 RepID=A0A6A5GXN2_CAERE|nr:hypothetical protein GCK72_015898 [Caenorhabditis remanei]KAF1759431.1 hypothetical protein GCK72_015898 [Caenorhabditis remanei]